MLAQGDALCANLEKAQLYTQNVVVHSERVKRLPTLFIVLVGTAALEDFGVLSQRFFKMKIDYLKAH